MERRAGELGSDRDRGVGGGWTVVPVVVALDRFCNCLLHYR